MPFNGDVADLAADALQLAASLVRWSNLLRACLLPHVLLHGVRYICSANQIDCATVNPCSQAICCVIVVSHGKLTTLVAAALLSLGFFLLHTASMVVSFLGFATQDWVLIAVPPSVHFAASLLVSLPTFKVVACLEDGGWTGATAYTSFLT